MKAITIKIKEKMLTGTISVAKAKCGNSKCKCHENKKYFHGPYYRWTGIIKNKRTTITMTEEMAEECKRRIENYKLLKKQIQKILEKAMDSAPWVSTHN